MILSRCHNPPYRPPSARCKASSPDPPSDSTTHRERESMPQTSPLRLLRLQERSAALVSSSEPGGSSPRSKTVERLRNLHLDPQQQAEIHSDDDNAPPRKRTKRSLPHAATLAHVDAPSSSRPTSIHPHASGICPAKPSRNRSPSSGSIDGPFNNIDHAPRSGFRSNSINHTSPVRNFHGPMGQHTPPDSPSRWQAPKQHHRSPVDFVKDVVNSTNSTPHSPASLPPPTESDESPDLDRTALTWQDDEITGHLIDESSPDDDGEGINGIGFKPTPSIAYARTQRRLRQVAEWKAREAREARQKRLEKRRRSTASEQRGVTRRVRFH